MVFTSLGLGLGLGTCDHEDSVFVTHELYGCCAALVKTLVFFSVFTSALVLAS